MSPSFADFVDAMQVTREDFFSGRTLRHHVRHEILASWRRSSLSGALPDVPALPYAGDIDLSTRLYRAALPVLDRLAGRLSQTTTAVLLADANARIIARWVGDPDLERGMDQVSSAPGFSLNEEVCGTNGLGSVVEERRALYVSGAEHYASRYVNFSCFGAPIRHPVTARLEGVLTFMCRVEDTSSLMMPFVLEATGNIEQQYLADVSQRDRVLLDAFLRASRVAKRPVVLVNEQTIIQSPAASRLLDGTCHALLWEAAAEAVTRQRTSTVVLPLAGDGAVQVVAEPVCSGLEVVGALIELHEDEGAPERRRSNGTGPRSDPLDALHRQLGGTSRPWSYALAAVARAARSREPLLLVGEPGTGKTELARALHAAVAPGGDLAVLDAALIGLDGAAVWLGRLRRALDDGGWLLVRRLHQLDEATGHAVGALIDDLGDGGGARLMGTVVAPGPGRWGPAAERFCVHRVDLPALRERTEDIPELVARCSAAAGHESIRFTAEAVQALSRAPWPGNIRQLDAVVRAAVGSRTVGDVQLDDLPVDIVQQAARRHGSALEEMELTAIMKALRESDGNKSLAAADLGISRSTLYRKLRSFGVDLERAAF